MIGNAAKSSFESGIGFDCLVPGNQAEILSQEYAIWLRKVLELFSNWFWLVIECEWTVIIGYNRKIGADSPDYGGFLIGF